MGRISKIKSATILETVIALTISLIIFSIATVIFINTSFKSTSLQIVKARESLKIYSIKTNERKLFFDEVIKEDEFILEREIEMKSYNSAIRQVRFSISNRYGDKIEEWKELMLP